MAKTIVRNKLDNIKKRRWLAPMHDARGHLHLILPVIVIVAVAAIGTLVLTKSHADTVTPKAAVTASTIPALPVFNNLVLHDKTVMQGFAYDSVNKVWVFAQLAQGGRFGLSGEGNADAGNMTLTEVSSRGKVLGYMYLQGFGHGVSIGVEPVGKTTYVWTEAKAKVSPYFNGAMTNGAYGTAIARFAWHSGVIINGSSPGVTTYGLNASLGATVQQPAIDYKDQLLATQYFNPKINNLQWAIYSLKGVENRTNYVALTRITWPTDLRSHVFQGWAILGKNQILSYAGTGYNATPSPAPNNTILSTVTAGLNFDSATGELPVNTGRNLSYYREPEGATNINGNICIGFASGNPGARRANIYCQRAVN